MERHPIPAVVISCDACGLVRITDNAAYARASAHIHPSTHHRSECTGVACTDRFKVTRHLMGGAGWDLSKPETR